MNYYEVLGIEPDAPQAKIKAQYRFLCFQTHPDLPSLGLTDGCVFARYAEAYSIIGDPVKRRKYNHRLGIKGMPRALKKGYDLRQRFVVSAAFAASGGKTKLTFIRYEPCTLCWLQGCFRCENRGQIPETVVLPIIVAPQTPNKSMMFLPRQGGASEPGGTRGDLLVEIIIEG